MQLLLIFGIAFAIGAVMFALQNNVPVTVTFVLWRFDSSLALVLLLALGLGAIIAGLVSSPTVIKGQWLTSRLRRQVSALEQEKAVLTSRIGELEAELTQLRPTPTTPTEAARPYVGIRSLLSGGDPQP